MEPLEKKMLKTIADNLKNAACIKSGEPYVDSARRMKQTIDQAIPMFITLLDEPEAPMKGGVILS